jgi:hypothetical protein
MRRKYNKNLYNSVCVCVSAREREREREREILPKNLTFIFLLNASLSSEEVFSRNFFSLLYTEKFFVPHFTPTHTLSLALLRTLILYLLYFISLSSLLYRKELLYNCISEKSNKTNTRINFALTRI